MKILLTMMAICTSCLFVYSQNLESEVTPEGIIFPAMNTGQRINLVNPVNGQCIYNVDRQRLECYDGQGEWRFHQSMGENATNNRNTFYGMATEANQTGRGNTAIGFFADIPDVGDYNTLLGNEAGDDMGNGSYNTFIGSGAGLESKGSNNIFIGAGMGSHLNGSNNLIIGPLLSGNSQEKYLTINGMVNVSEFMKLTPLDDAPTCDSNALGSVYMDRQADKLMLCTSTGWKGIMMEP